MVSKLKGIYSFVRDVFREFGEDRGGLVSAAMAFFGLLSLIPLLLLAIAIFGYVIGSSDEAFNRVVSFAKDFIPVAAEGLEENLDAVRTGSGVLGGLGLLGLLWTGSQLFVILQQALNIALGVKKRTGFIRARSVAIGMVFVAGVLFTLSVGITSLLSAVRDFNIEILGISPSDLEAVWDFTGMLVPTLLSILMFAFIYRFLPTRDIGNTGPIIGGVTAGLLFETAKHGFRWYVSNVANFTAVYGSLGGVIILVLWIYYVSMITVLGAEVASVYRKHELEQAAEGGPRR